MNERINTFRTLKWTRFRRLQTVFRFLQRNDALSNHKLFDMSCYLAIFQIVNLNLGLIALAITYALSTTSLLNGLLGSFVETEKEMVSVERIAEYVDEAPKERCRGNLQVHFWSHHYRRKNFVSWKSNYNCYIVTYEIVRRKNSFTYKTLFHLAARMHLFFRLPRLFRRVCIYFSRAIEIIF